MQCGEDRLRFRRWRRRRGELFIDDFIESSFRLCPTDENAIDEEARRAADTRAHAILVVLLNLRFVFSRRNAAIEPAAGGLRP